MNNVVDLVARKKIKAITSHVKELDELSTILKGSISSLTKYDKYASVKRRVEDLFVLYQDIKRAKETKLDVLQRLKDD